MKKPSTNPSPQLKNTGGKHAASEPCEILYSHFRDIFPAAIHSQETAYKVDFRMEMNSARMEAVELPEDVIARLHNLMKRLGLVYGAIDMRLTPDGRYVFLEINPAGQWLFVEQQTGQPITKSLVRLLLANSVSPKTIAPNL